MEFLRKLCKGKLLRIMIIHIFFYHGCNLKLAVILLQFKLRLYASENLPKRMNRFKIILHNQRCNQFLVHSYFVFK